MAKNTWIGSDQWIAERMSQAAQYAGIAAGFGEREAELRAEAEDARNESHPDLLTAAADDCVGQRRRYRAMVIATLNDVLPFITKV